MLEKLRWVQKTVEILPWIALCTGEIFNIFKIFSFSLKSISELGSNLSGSKTSLGKIL